MNRSLLRIGRSRALAVFAFVAACWATAKAVDARPLVMVVMDPLAAPLSCPCVAGYAQRDYEQLAGFLQQVTGCEVATHFSESLTSLDPAIPPPDIVIGKRSVVEADSKALVAAGQSALLPVASLTDQDGSPWQHGLVVVHCDDPVEVLADLGGHTIFLGPVDCAEKNAAARALFDRHGLEIAAATISAACSDGAAAVIEAGKAGGRPAATVISSYAQPLLEGCGTIRKGDLRVIGRTGNVPFVTAFVAASLQADLREAVQKAFLAVGDEPLLRLALETKRGFIPLVAVPETQPDAPDAGDQSGVVTPRHNDDWPGWRGRKRDGRVRWLPERLPQRDSLRWNATLFGEGVGGVAVAAGVAVVGDRDLADERDVFHGFDAATGKRLWKIYNPEAGDLYDPNTKRATPLIVYGSENLLGAFGHLHCCDLRTGKIVWQRHIREEFQASDELVWGVASSPLLSDGQLILNPGGPQAALVALDPQTGEILWQSPGNPAAFASFVLGTVMGRRQLVGFDKISCGGWDPATGERLWTYTPKVAGDFNVPTPLLLGEQIFLVSENNGARLLGFQHETPAVQAYYEKLRPDMHTPVVTAGRIFAVHDGKVVCLEAATLRLLWSAFDRSLKGHVSLIAADDHILLQTQSGELLVIDAQAEELAVVSRTLPFRRAVSTYAHPAIAGDAIFVRGPGKLLCLPLEAQSEAVSEVSVSSS